ncbi:MAG: GGDEF domain-containing protein, partial [Mesorhizobium sp.]|nr:GGDEF domain-containing protein [Mesorhizobium sp.]
TAASFLLCALVLVRDGQLVLGRAPDNWAEDLSLAIAIAGMSGIGALSLALNHWRLAQAHRRDAMTDSLTGLLNRRALFERHEHAEFGPFHAVVVFDLDRFKTINDQHGHAAGDAVLEVFARKVAAALRPGDSAARLGGEEFAIVMQRTLPERAAHLAEHIRATFAATPVETPSGPLLCTVSAGIAFGSAEKTSFARLLSLADRALYAAKDAGRNRVVADEFKIAG